MSSIATSTICTYFLRCETTGLIKIGRARNVERRAMSIAYASPTKITLLGLIRADVEGDLHAEFADARIKGEWFRLDKDELISRLEPEGFERMEFRRLLKRGRPVTTGTSPVLRVRLSKRNGPPSDWETIKETAAKAGLEMSTYVRARSLRVARMELANE